eukprot:gene23416-28413_t
MYPSMKAAPIDYHHLYKSHFFPNHREFVVDKLSAIAELAAQLPPYRMVVESKLNSNKVKTFKYSFKSCGEDGGESLGTLHEPKVAEMLKLAKPSPYGKRSQTVYDRSVRDGKELKYGRDFVIEEEERFYSLLSAMSTQRICGQLFPQATDIAFKVNKIAIYQKDGHFKPHRDTAYAPNHRGTLLIALQAPHIGGDLVLGVGAAQVIWKTAGDGTDIITDMKGIPAEDAADKADAVGEGDAANAVDNKAMDLVKNEAAEEGASSSIPQQEDSDSTEASDDEAASRVNFRSVTCFTDDTENYYDYYGRVEQDEEDAVLLPWVSFPCSTLHEVLPVTAGIRMVLQVDLYIETKSGVRQKLPITHFMTGRRNVSEKDHKLRCAHERLQALVNAVAQDTRRVHALPLFCVYPYSSIQPQYLLPLDRSVFDAFVAAGFEVQLVPTVTKICSDYENEYDKATHQVWQVNYVAEAYVRDPSSPEGYRLVEKKMAPSADVTRKVAGYEEVIDSKEKVAYHETLLHNVKLMRSTHYVEYTGNEPAAAEHEYFTCAMILRKKPDTSVTVGDEVKAAGDV